MITKTKINLYIIYLFFLAIWIGSAFHDTFSTNYTWYSDPITYINYTTEHNIPGGISPWPFSTMLLMISAIIAMVAFRRYTDHGKKEVMISLTGTLIIIAITLIYFVPTLGKVFGVPNQHSNESLISMSRIWVILNIIRFFVLAFLFFTGLRGLGKIYTK